jgi:exopolysaccharide biosynthesis polyprenyl glycosylphosphotransferase
VQYNLKHGKSLVPTPNSCPTEQEFLQVDKDHSYMTELIQRSQFKESQGVQRKQKPSPTIWSLALIMGDGILFTSLFALVLMLIVHTDLALRVSSYIFGTRNLKIVLLFLALVSWSLAGKLTQAQKLINASNRFKSVFHVFGALVLTSIFWMMLTYPSTADIASDTEAKVLLFFLLLGIPIFGIWRIAFAEIISLPRFRPLAVIVGANAAGEAIAKELQSTKHPIATAVGCIDGSAREDLKIGGLPVLGSQGMLHFLVGRGMIDMIIVAFDYQTDPGLFKEVTEAANKFRISVVPMTVIYEENSGKIPVEYVSDHWYITLPLEQVAPLLYLCWRKALDLVFGLCGLFAMCFILPVLAILIYLDSPGPIFYSQERLGMHGKPFRIYKFRSMRINAETDGQAIWATECDSRVTKIGRFLRATHLDELPQVLNILKGDMSLIGPRPERAEFVAELENSVPFYRHRLAVKPGLTGWAQIKLRYGNTDNDALIKLKYDLYYIKRQSFTLDIFIILKTVVEVVFARGV